MPISVENDRRSCEREVIRKTSWRIQTKVGGNLYLMEWSRFIIVSGLLEWQFRWPGPSCWVVLDCRYLKYMHTTSSCVPREPSETLIQSEIVLIVPDLMTQTIEPCRESFRDWYEVYETLRFTSKLCMVSWNVYKAYRSHTKLFRVSWNVYETFWQPRSQNIVL